MSKLVERNDRLWDEPRGLFSVGIDPEYDAWLEEREEVASELWSYLGSNELEPPFQPVRRCYYCLREAAVERERRKATTYR